MSFGDGKKCFVPFSLGILLVCLCQVGKPSPFIKAVEASFLYSKDAS